MGTVLLPALPKFKAAAFSSSANGAPHTSLGRSEPRERRPRSTAPSRSQSLWFVEDYETEHSQLETPKVTALDALK